MATLVDDAHVQEIISHYLPVLVHVSLKHIRSIHVRALRKCILTSTKFLEHGSSGSTETHPCLMDLL